MEELGELGGAGGVRGSLEELEELGELERKRSVPLYQSPGQMPNPDVTQMARHAPFSPGLLDPIAAALLGNDRRLYPTGCSYGVG